MITDNTDYDYNNMVILIPFQMFKHLFFVFVLTNDMCDWITATKKRVTLQYPPTKDVFYQYPQSYKPYPTGIRCKYEQIKF